MKSIKLRAQAGLLALLLTGYAATAVAQTSGDRSIKPATEYVQQFRSGTEVRDIIREIIDVVGLKPKFEIKASPSVPNAAAVIYGGKRYILYNERFVNSINNAVNTDWAGVSILAHEIGHHLNGHTLGGEPNPSLELEADEFSGFVLRKMGASLADAQAAMRVVSEEEASATHPGRDSRLASIATGWNNAEKQIIASTSPNSRNVARKNEGIRNEPVRDEQPTVTLASQYIFGQIRFTSIPNSRFYVTTRGNLIQETGRGLQVIGKVTKTTSRIYPYMISGTNIQQLYVANNGVIINSQRQRVGIMQTA